MQKKLSTAMRPIALGAAMLFGIAVLWSLTPSTAAPPSADVAAEVIALEKKALALSDKKGADALAALLPDDVVVVSELGRQTRDEALRMFKEIDVDVIQEGTDFQTHQLGADVVAVTYRVVSADKEAPVVWTTSIWTRRDGKWWNVLTHTSVGETTP